MGLLVGVKSKLGNLVVNWVEGTKGIIGEGVEVNIGWGLSKGLTMGSTWDVMSAAVTGLAVGPRDKVGVIGDIWLGGGRRADCIGKGCGKEGKGNCRRNPEDLGSLIDSEAGVGITTGAIQEIGIPDEILGALFNRGLGFLCITSVGAGGVTVFRIVNCNVVAGVGDGVAGWLLGVVVFSGEGIVIITVVSVAASDVRIAGAAVTTVVADSGSIAASLVNLASSHPVGLRPRLNISTVVDIFPKELKDI